MTTRKAKVYGRMVRQFRHSVGLSAEQAAMHWGMTKNVLLKIENGHHLPSFSKALKIYTATGIGFDALLKALKD